MSILLTSRRARRILALGALSTAVTWASAGPAMAQTKVGVMGLRAAQPGTVGVTTVNTVNQLLWQAASSVQGIQPIAEPQVVSVLGAGGAGGASSCKDDACMSSLASAAGLDRIVYAVAVQGGADSWAVYVRTVQVAPFAVVAQAAPTCTSCGEADCSRLVGGLNLAPFFAPGPAGAIGGGGPVAAKPAKLSLTSKPAGAQVTLGGQPLGVTPLSDVELPAGAHTLSLALQGYQPAQATVQLKAGKRTKKNVKLTAAKATTGVLTLTTKPPGAQVTLGGRPLGVTPLSSVEVYPGTHTLGLTLQGHRPQQIRVLVQAGKTLTQKITLKPLPATTGKLTLTSKPPGAEVRLGQQVLGVTPLKAVVLPRGDHQLQVTLAGHLPSTLPVRIDPGGSTTKKVTLRVIPSTTGVVKVTSKPPGATVVSGANNWGVTPVTLPKVPPGSYPVTVQMQGFAPVHQNLGVKAGEEAVLSVKLEAFGGLEVKVVSGGKPVPAQLAVNGRAAGAAPLSVKEIAPGSYEIAVSAQGLKPVTKKVEVKAGKVAKVVLDLQAPMGKLTLTSKPSGAEVHDGAALLGKTPMRRLKIGAGPHSLSVRLKGYAPANVQVDIKDGGEAKQAVTLTPLPATLIVVTTAGGKPLPGTDVKVDGQLVGRTPLTWPKLTPGKHTVEISRQGVVPVRKTVNVGPAGKAELSIPLRVPQGRLTLTTKPDGAQIVLSGQVLGTTPVKNMDLAAGEHTLTIRKKGWIDVELVLSVKDKQTVRKRLELKPLPPTLVVDSTPPGASVLIGGKPAGKTPLRKSDLRPGAYEVKLELKGHRVITRKIKLENQKITKLSEGLTARQGTLQVTTAPAGATVILDGKELGKTPLSPTATVEGEHTLKLLLDRYDEAERRVMVTEGGLRKVSVTLTPKLGSLQIASNPPGASITVDGKPSGTTPATLTGVALGKHNILMSLADHKPQHRAVELQPGDSVSVSVDMALTDAAIARANWEQDREANEIYMWSAFAGAGVLVIAGTSLLAINNSREAALHDAVDVYNRYHQRTDQPLDPTLSAGLAADVSDADQAAREFPYTALGWTSFGLAAAAGAYGAWLLLGPPPGSGDEAGNASILAPMPLHGGGWGLTFTGALPRP